MKKIFLCVLLVAMGMLADDYDPIQTLDNCVNGDKQACRTFIVKSRVACNNYNVLGCDNLALSYLIKNNRQLFYKNITDYKYYKDWYYYTMKACMLGANESCEFIEEVKMTFENCKDFSKMSMSECLKDLQ